ncbi:hypothetical protein C8R43DRAFT_965197 [Mycena crocata]|nr:hypothetical protein C8R43DRAFT_965197 [Mycena crocata]
MPLHNTSSTQTRLNNTVTGLVGVVNSLEVLAGAFKAPFLKAISKTARSLLTLVQTVKQNKNDCANLIEQASTFLYVIVSIYVKSYSGPDLPPGTLNHIGKFMETLHTIHTYVEAQQDTNKIRQFFRQGELSTLLKACATGLEEALDVFKFEDMNLLANVADIQKYMADMHQEVLQMIEALSDTSDTGSVRMFSTLDNSSTSISMLPSEPKIFHGRETELAHILDLCLDNRPRLAILGPGGIEKTSLAKAVLHHPQITQIFEHRRFFVASDKILHVS